MKEVADQIIKDYESGDTISIPIIQRRYKKGYYVSKQAFDYLVDNGIILKGIKVSKML